MFPAPLPDLDALDPEALKALVIAKHNESLQQHEQLTSKTQEIEHLKLVIEKYRRMIFGRKSEKLTRELEQLELRLEELETAQAAEETAPETAESKQPSSSPNEQQRRSARPRRKPLPEDLPREVITHLPPLKCCPDCGGELRKFGEDVSEQLERIPASYKVIRHVRPKFACAAGCDRVVEAPAPARPIEFGLPGPNLLAHVLVSKYSDHQPLYRQSEIYAREGIDLDRSTLAGWVGAASELLTPLADEIRKHVMAASKIHADDTPIPVLAPGTGKTKTGRLWTYVRDERPAGYETPPAVWFAYSEDRKGEHPRNHLKDFQGRCRPMLIPGSTTFTAMAAFTRFRVGATRGVNSTTFMWRTPRQSPPRPSIASELCTESRKRFAASLWRPAALCARRGPSPCSMTFAPGWRSLFTRFPPRAKRQEQSAMRSPAGGL